MVSFVGIRVKGHSSPRPKERDGNKRNKQTINNMIDTLWYHRAAATNGTAAATAADTSEWRFPAMSSILSMLSAGLVSVVEPRFRIKASIYKHQASILIILNRRV